MNLIKVNRSEDLASQNENSIAQTSSSNPSSPVSASTDDIFGDPIFSPRLGDDYQAKIPSMLVNTQHLRASEFPSDTGLSIPIMWVHNHLPTSCSALKSEIIGSTLHNKKAHRCPTYQISACNGCSPLPECRVSLWSEEEIQGFLLGLYIFGKNLVQVRKLFGCKDMKDVLSFYYGKFYRSDAYHRWADCRKSRSRKCIQGQRIFTGWRQRELLSRILMGMSNEEQGSLIEATKAFNEGKLSLEELVFTLRAAVGIVALVEAVAIGKGKQDLTGFILDPNRTNQPLHSSAEIPVGKACSSLALTDIVKFLTGDFRLSKAKSNDLFWEAVWPRLLARGWHSERPKHFCTKNTIVFLIPDIRKFSRKLVKGDQYFDSVTDVLSKVASDPQLLELETGAEENGVAKVESQTNVSNHQHLAYLRPRFADCNADLMKFTVVDTSLIDVAAGSFKLRELRSLPFEVVGHSVMDEANSDSSTEQSTDTSLSEKVSSEEACISTSIQVQTDQPKNLPNDSKLEGGNIPLDETIQLDQSASLAPLLKRQRLSACKQAMRNGRHKLLFEEKIDSGMEAVEASEKASTAKSSGSSFEDSFYLEKPQRALFDLNQPQFPLDFDTEPLYQTAKPQSFDGSQVTLNQSSSADEDPSSNGRRHGTRNRPPTAKALEAFACGFLSIGRTGKDVKRTRLHGIRSRPRLAHRKAEAPLPATAVLAARAPTIGFVDPNLLIPEVRYRTNLFAEPQIKSERKEAHDLLGLF